MLPKITFICSSLYDQVFNNKENQEMLKLVNKKYPSVKKIRSYIGKIESLWRKDEKKILNAISKFTGLKWKEKEMKCYVIGFGRPMSEPLTIKLYKNKNDFIDSLTHELIHKIQSQNRIKYKTWHEYILIKYKKESQTTKNHIFIHAILKEIYLNVLGKSRLKRDIKRCKSPDYARAWQIVETEGYKNIINKFRELTKER